MQQQIILQTAQFETKLGNMIAVADDAGLYLLEFMEYRHLDRAMTSIRKKFHANIEPGESKIIDSVKAELDQYFAGNSLVFKTPVHLTGTAFQNTVWEQLQKIPAGETRSYLDLAKALHKPAAFRAVAQANGTNPLVIIVPCHRVINTNGALGGYSCGLERKQWLLEHEKSLRQ